MARIDLPNLGQSNFGRRVSEHGFKRHAARLLLFSLVCARALSLAWAAGNAPSTVPFRIVHGFAVVVPVFINGSGPYDFLLDTGSTCTTVDRALGGSLHIEAEGLGTVTTVARKEQVSLALARSVSFGPFAEQNVELLVRDLDGLSSLDRGVRGVLGQNVLNRTDYLIDYQRRILRFDADGDLLTTLTGERMQLTRFATPDNPQYFILTLHTRISGIGNREANLVLDSGTASLVLFSGTAARGSAVRQESTVEDDGGGRLGVELRKVQLRIGGRSWDTAARAFHAEGSMLAVDGLLPMSLFSSLYVSNTGGFVLLTPKATRHNLLARALAHSTPEPTPTVSARQTFLP